MRMESNSPEHPVSTSSVLKEWASFGFSWEHAPFWVVSVIDPPPPVQSKDGKKDSLEAEAEATRATRPKR